MNKSTRKLIVLAVLFSGTLFGLEVNAETVFDTNWNAVENTCWDGFGEGLCTDGVGYSNPGTYRIYQELHLPVSSADPEITITGLSFYFANSSGIGGTEEVRLMDTDQLTSWLAGGTMYGHATGTIQLKNGEQKVDFSADPCVVNLAGDCPVGYVGIHLDISGGSPYVAQIRTAGDLYPTTSDFPFLWNGYYQSDTLSDDKDWMITVYRDETPLTFESPTHMEVVEPNFELSGTCNTNFNLTLMNTFNYDAASTTAFFFGTEICSANTFSKTIASLSDEYWYAWATTTEQAVYRKFYFDDPDVISEIDFDYYSEFTAGWTCDLAIIGDPCAAAAAIMDNVVNGVMDFVQGIYLTFRDSRPYAYIFEIKDSITSSISTASSTPESIGAVSISVPTSTAFTTGLPITLFDADTFEELLDETTWAGVRLIGVLSLYLVFLIFLYRKFIKVI